MVVSSQARLFYDPTAARPKEQEQNLRYQGRNLEKEHSQPSLTIRSDS